MEVEVKAQDLLSYEGDALIVNLFEGVKEPGGATRAVDKALAGSIAAAIRRQEFKGKLHERLLLHTFGRLPVHFPVRQFRPTILLACKRRLPEESSVP